MCPEKCPRGPCVQLRTPGAAPAAKCLESLLGKPLLAAKSFNKNLPRILRLRLEIVLTGAKNPILWRSLESITDIYAQPFRCPSVVIVLSAISNSNTLLARRPHVEVWLIFKFLGYDYVYHYWHRKMV